MSAYAAVVSLMNLMEDIHNHPRLSTSLHKKQIESLGQSLNFLLDFIESYRSDGGSKEVAEDLERQIASAAHAAEDVIESHVVDQILNGDESNKSSRGCLLDLQKLIQGMDYVKEKVIEVEYEMGVEYKRPKYSTMPTASSTPHTTSKITMVGAEDELRLLMDGITARESSRQIISIVGMGGIGKTTLAQNVYEDKAIIRHFDFRAWATISQEYNLQEIILQLLSKSGESTSETFEELGEKLHRMLYGRRYLIILDDMWSTLVWDKIKFYFPNGNESRIVITTRLSNMDIPSCSSPIKMKLLDEHKSWDLFCQKAFGKDEDFAPELEEIGKGIVKKCKGLPLPIVVVGRHLGKSSKMKKYWESVANEMNSILNSGEEEQCLDILSLSYTYLPAHLKPCFLFMGLYGEDQEIFVPYLINLWVAEGFLKPNKAQNLEEVAEDHLKDLIERNLISVHKRGHLGKIGYVKIHDLLREMSIKVAKKEKFICELNSPRAIDAAERRIVFRESIDEEKHHPQILHALRSAQHVRSLICDWGELPFAIKLLKVVNTVSVEANGGTLDAKFQQVNLRYIFYNVVVHESSHRPYPPLYLPPSICLLWNLQTLIIRGPFAKFLAPSDIWNMPQLRHLEFSEVCFPDPLPNDGGVVLQNLHTLLGVVNFKLVEEVCRRLPNVKEMEMKYQHFPEECEEASSCYCPNNLGRFHKLESLKCTFGGKLRYWYGFARNLAFPDCLRELTLINCPLRWEDMSLIGRIPLLSDLTLICSGIGREWGLVEGEFRCLKSLAVFGGSLVCWNAESSHLPLLENLAFGGASSLVEIPLDIGENATLRCINLQTCSMSAVVSAVRIVVEQEELGNLDILLELEFSDPAEEERFIKVVEEEGFNCSNLRLIH